MAQLTKAQFLAKYTHATNGLFRDNTTGELAEADLRAFVEDVKDSFLHTDDEVSGVPAGGTPETVLFGDGWKNFMNAVRQVQPTETQLPPIEEYNAALAYAFPYQVKYTGRIWDAKTDVPVGQTPPTLANVTENTFWKELSATHLQNTDTALRLTNGSVVTSDDLAYLNSVVPSNRRDPNFQGEFTLGVTRFWQWISILERKFNELLLSLLSRELGITYEGQKLRADIRFTGKIQILSVSPGFRISSLSYRLTLNTGTETSYTTFALLNTAIAALSPENAANYEISVVGVYAAGYNKATIEVKYKYL